MADSDDLKKGTGKSNERVPGRTGTGKRKITEDSPRRSPNTEKPTVAPRDPHTEPKDPPPKRDKNSG